MKNISGILSIKEITNRIIYETGGTKEKYKLYRQHIINCICQINLLHTGYPKVIKCDVSDLNTVELPDDYMQFVAIGIPINGKLFEFVREDGMITTTTDTYVSDILLNLNIKSIIYDYSTNKLYAGGDDKGLWEYDYDTKEGKIYNISSGADNGDQLPNNSVTTIFKDKENDILYVGTDGGGVWFYSSSTGDIYNTSFAVGSGDQLPSNNITWVTKDSNILWVATDAGVWKYDIANDTGTVYNTAGGAGAGSQLPNNDVRSIYFDVTDNTLWAGTNGGGVWKYDVTADTGSIYNNAGGVGSGDDLPNDNVFCLVKNEVTNILWAGTNGGGVWKYDVTTDTGSIYNNAGGVGSGDELPNDIVYSIDNSDNKIFAGTASGVWILDDNNAGKVYNTTGYVSRGNKLQGNSIYAIFYDQEEDRIFTGTNKRIWELNIIKNQGIIYNTANISSETQTSTQGEGENINNGLTSGYGATGGISDYYYTIKGGRIYINGTNPQNVILKYISTGVDMDGNTYVPRYYYPVIKAYVRLEEADMDNNPMAVSRIGIRKSRYDEEIANLRTIEQPTLNEIYDAFLKLRTPTIYR